MKTLTIVNWLEENTQLFARQPIVHESNGWELAITFEATTPHLKTYISLDGHSFMIAVEHPLGEVWDYVSDFDLSPRKSESDQFYCNLCTERELYSSEIELWETHSLKPWANWMNAVFVSPHNIRLAGSIEEGFTAANVVEIGIVSNNDDFFHTTYPVNAIP